MRRAYQRAEADAEADKDSFTSIVLMTDGENNQGISVEDFLASLAAVPEPARSVKTFAVQFGEANPAELRRIVQSTNGAMFDANDSSLAAAFKEIRGYHRGQRLLRYLYSSKNLVGCAAGLAGLGLYFTGVVGELWPVVVGGLYGVGALATPPTRTVDLHSGLDAANLNRAMAEQARRLRGRVPDDVLAAVARVHTQVREILARRDALPPASVDAFVVERTALDYLPTALESYLNLPRAYANRVAISPGRTARQVLLAQLALLEAKLSEVLEAVTKGDTDRLLAHGRFLEDRFARSEMDLG